MREVSLGPVLNLWLYTVSENGVILDRKKNPVPITPNGMVSLKRSDRSGVVSISAHRIVALAFVPNPEGYHYVTFLDGDLTNRHASNLSWRRNNGALYGTTKEKVQQLVNAGMSTPRITEKLGVSPQYVNSIKRKH